MMTAYLRTFEWGVDWVEENLEFEMKSMRSALFVQRGIRPGDLMYLAYIDDDRRLNLISRVEVERVLPDEPDEPDGEELLEVRPGASTEMELDRVVPDEVARALRFLVRNGFDANNQPRYQDEKTELTYERDGRLTNQTARTIRRLDDESAALLDTVLA